MLTKIGITLLSATLSLGLATASAPAASALPGWRTSATHHLASHSPRTRVVGLRTAKHEGFDRVVVDVLGSNPSYHIAYTRRLVQDGSGKPVRLRGSDKMLLVIHGARAHNRHGDTIYTGPRRRHVDLPTLRGVATAGDFEGEVSFGFTTNRRAPYRSFVLTNPTRIVIDWRH